MEYSNYKIGSRVKRLKFVSNSQGKKKVKKTKLTLQENINDKSILLAILTLAISDLMFNVDSLKNEICNSSTLKKGKAHIQVLYFQVI